MQERERTVVTGLVILMLLLWLGFAVHRSPRFPGSLIGGLLGVSGAVLMTVPLAYLVIKRVKPLKRRVTALVSMRTLLAAHIYAGIVGPILALLHTGHRFESPLGIALTAMMLTVVLSGFVGRYLMGQVTREIRDKKNMLAELETEYRRTADGVAEHPCCAPEFRPLGLVRRAFAPVFFATAPAHDPQALTLSAKAIGLAQAIADVEYAVKTHETVKRLFAAWLRFHIAISAVLYVLLALHVSAAVYFGLRWLE